jgi:hypothetical protein
MSRIEISDSSSDVEEIPKHKWKRFGYRPTTDEHLLPPNTKTWEGLRIPAGFQNFPLRDDALPPEEDVPVRRSFQPMRIPGTAIPAPAGVGSLRESAVKSRIETPYVPPRDEEHLMEGLKLKAVLENDDTRNKKKTREKDFWEPESDSDPEAPQIRDHSSLWEWTKDADDEATRLEGEIAMLEDSVRKRWGINRLRDAAMVGVARSFKKYEKLADEYGDRDWFDPITDPKVLEKMKQQDAVWERIDELKGRVHDLTGDHTVMSKAQWKARQEELKKKKEEEAALKEARKKKRQENKEKRAARVVAKYEREQKKKQAAIRKIERENKKWEREHELNKKKKKD